MTPHSAELLAITHYLDREEVPDEVHALCETLLDRYQHAVQAVLFYGSCLRTGVRDDSMVDLYVVVTDYATIYGNRMWAAMNTLLPPNVYYLEIPYNGQALRAKYAVLSMKTFRRASAPEWFHSYFWARFAQPTKVLFAATPGIQKRIYATFADAITTLITQTLPLVPNPFTAHDLWRTGLLLTYQAELRSERAGRIQDLLAAHPDYYQQAGDVVLGHMSERVQMKRAASPRRYRTSFRTYEEHLSHWSWLVRQGYGKVLSVLRLIKAFFTFQGGVDYLLWKIERHSGVTITLSPWQRRHPLLSAPLVCWRLYRKGAFR